LDENAIFFVVIVALFINGIIGSIIGSFVDKKLPGFWFGLALGPIGWIIVLLLPRNEESTAKQTGAEGSSSTLAALKWKDISCTTDPIKFAAFADAFPGSEEAFLASQRKHQLDHWRRADQTDASMMANLFSDTEFDWLREEIRATIAKNASANEPMERLHREILDKEATVDAAMRESERKAAERRQEEEVEAAEAAAKAAALAAEAAAKAAALAAAKAAGDARRYEKFKRASMWVFALVLTLFFVAAYFSAERARANAERTRTNAKLMLAQMGENMVVLPSGSFTMGSPEIEAGRDDDEGPQRTVQIGYQLAVGKHEVTFAEWDACVADGGCGDYRPSDEGWGRGNRPVINVSWQDAQAYVSWLNQKTGLSGRADAFRLLSEAEWEYAARAGSAGRWSFGEEESRLGDHAWFFSNSNGGTQPVGEKAANAFGLHDIHGNVWEWTEDCFESNYNSAPSDGSAQTAFACSYRAYRGGSISDGPDHLRSAYRYREASVYRDSILGFRVARTLSAN
jgi:formylglycine-generating enzyme required for sulfatase activity